MGEDIEQFEGVIKKVMNHREVVQKYEQKQEDGSSSDSLESEDLEKEEVEELKDPHAAYEGQRQPFDQMTPFNVDEQKDQRRSHSELNLEAIKKSKDESNGKDNKFKNPLALDLEPVIGKDAKTDKVFSLNDKAMMQGKSKKGERSAKRSSRKSRISQKLPRVNQKMTSNVTQKKMTTRDENK